MIEKIPFPIINQFRRNLGASQIHFKRYRLPFDDKTELWKLVDSGNEAQQLSAVYILSEVLGDGEIIELAQRIAPENHLSLDILIIVSNRLREGGQELFQQLFNSECAYKKKLAVFAIKEFGDKRFIESCKEFVLEILSNSNRVQPVQFLRLTELTAPYCYFERIDPDSASWLLEQFRSNSDQLDYSEKLWLQKERQSQFS